MAKTSFLLKLALSFCFALPSLVQAAPTGAGVQLLDPRHAGCSSDGKGVHIIVARGSTEPPGEGSLGAVSDIIKSAIPGATSKGVNYPAILSPYQWSVGEGTTALTKEIEDHVARCPASRIVLMGYSQGGQVVMNALCGTNEYTFTPTPRLPQHLWHHIAAVLVYADPSHLAGQSYDMGTSSLNGMFPRELPQLCEPFANRIQAYCDWNDPYCASGWDGSVHTGYFDKYDAVASQWMIAKTKAHLPWRRHH